MDQEAQKELQQKYFQLQMIDGQIQQLQKNHKLLDDQIADLISTKENLENISKTKADSEILTPVAPGIFVKASLKEASEVVVNAGSNVAVKKKIPAAKEMLDKQLNDIKEAQTKILFELTQMSNQAMQLEKEINKVAVE